MMPGSPAYILKVSGPQAFLASCGAAVRHVPAQEFLFKLVHAGACKKKRRVIFGHKRIARHDLMAFGAKKFQKCLSYIIGFHILGSRDQGPGAEVQGPESRAYLLISSIIFLITSYLNPRRIRKSYTLFVAFLRSSFLNLSNRSFAILKATSNSS